MHSINLDNQGIGCEKQEIQQTGEKRVSQVGGISNFFGLTWLGSTQLA